MDELWVSTETDNGIKSTIGIIYRHPKANLTKYDYKLYTVLQKIDSDKAIDMCHVVADFNVNLINHEIHHPTEIFLNNFISLPCIHLPKWFT